MTEDNFITPSEGSPTWVAELRRRCPTPEETDALCDKADRLAAIERDLRELAKELDNDDCTLPTKSSGYRQGVDNGYAMANQQVARKLRAILDPEGS